MIQELQYAMSIVPNLEKIMFYEDDFFAKNISSFKRVIDQYSKSIGLDINANGTIRQITEEKIDYILDNGIKIDFLKVGLQSPSERINKDVYLRSHFRCQDYLEKLPMMARKRIRVIVDIISDNPYETTTDKVDGIKFYIKLSLALSCVDESWKYISFMDHKLMFYPGTELYQRAIQDRTIPYDYIEKVLLSRTTERSLDQVDIDSIIIGLFRLSLKYYQIIWIMRIISHEKILSLVISSLRSRIVMITLANFKKILRYKLKR